MSRLYVFSSSSLLKIMILVHFFDLFAVVQVRELSNFLMVHDVSVAQTMKELPPLCIARNIACNVRGYFFK